MTAPLGPREVQDLLIAASVDESMAELKQTPNEQVAPNEPESDGTTRSDRDKAMLRAIFGDLFPPAQDAPKDEDDAAWEAWVASLWQSRAQAMRQHIHLIRRNRLMRAGEHWVSSKGGGPWRPKPAQRDQVRAVWNLTAAALDQRLQIIVDQRPGFSVAPATQDPADRKRAAARQIACEFQFDQMRMAERAREAEFWAQTDGVAFWHFFWNPDIGPWDENLSEDGTEVPGGDCDCRTLRCEMVRVSPEATATIPPSWVVIRETISVSEAVARYGYVAVQGEEGSRTSMATGDEVGSFDEAVLSMAVPGTGDNLLATNTVEKFTVYLAPQPDLLPNGLELTLVGGKLATGPNDLLFGVIPIVRVADGSSDPSYFPRPIMEQWYDSQMRIDALLSKWYENIRVNSGGRFFTRPSAIVSETFLGGATSMIEVKGVGPLRESIEPFTGFSVGNDVKEALALEKAAFEDMSGYNAVSRGQVTGESGRAIIASREQLERVFAPPVHALATAYTHWAKVVLAMMGHFYDFPRDLGVVGRSRPDLARAITGADLDSVSDVRVEPATMMPMPLSFRLYMLDNWVQSGIIDKHEYRRRQMFAVTRDIQTPDEDQEARARRVSDALIRGEEPPPIRWQDDEAIHQDVLERDILLQDDLPNEVIAAANARWFELANQAQRKQMQMMMSQMPPTGETGEGDVAGAQNAAAIPPGQVPLPSTNPPVGGAPMVTQSLTGTPDAEQAARMEETSTVA